jgi:hypothetical protein
VTGYSVARRLADGRQSLRFGGGKLAPDLTLGRLREQWDSSPAARAEALREWSAGPAARAARTGGGYGGQVWQEAAGAAAATVNRLLQVPAEDTAAWAAAARETAGVFAAWSSAAEKSGPGPLARAADVLAASAQTRRGEPRARRAELADLRGIAAVVLAGSPAGRGTLGWVMLLRQVIRLMDAVRSAQLARREFAQAAQLEAVATGELGRLQRSFERPGATRPGAVQQPGRGERDGERG